MSSKSDKKSQKFNRMIRFVILILILLFVTSMGVMHQKLETLRPAGVDAFCPFGAIESFYFFITSGSMLKNIASSSFILMIAVVLAALVFRRTFCGNICTLGALQEIFARIGKLFLKKRLNIPAVFDKPLRYLKYLVLLLVVIFTYKAGELIIRPYDPWVTYQHITSPELFTEFLFGFIILIVTIIGSFLFDRFFCKYLCPMGAFLGIINRVGWFRIERNESSCINCKACDEACPVNIPVESMTVVNSSECINCNECVNVCPVKDTLIITRNNKTKISPLLMLILSLLLYGSVIAVSTLSGNFRWTQSTLQEEVKKSGTFDTSMIKGSMTFKDVSEVSGIPKDEFIKEFKISDEEFTMQMKLVKDKYGFDIEAVREFVKNYKK